MGTFRLTDLRTEYQDKPLGLDILHPRFSWRFADCGRGFVQTACRILVTLSGKETAWDSGRMEDRTSTGICYRGEALKACTRYNVQVTVWGKDEGTEEQEASLDSWFETGLLDTSLAAFEGGTFIGAPEKYLSARTMGVFVLSSKIRITEGKSRAGIVFGAKDARLMDPRKNQYEIAGDNYIRYVLDVSRIPATLEIWRVGYAPQDRSDAPFYTGPVREILRTKDNGMEEGAPVITEENRYQEHELKIEVIGDCAYAYLDGLLIDGEMRHGMMGDSLEARQLNPLDYNDTTTFPRLCEIGYYVGAGDEARFSGISVRNYRTPKAEVVCLDREGLSLKGEDGTGCPVEMQITRDPSVHSLPMFRRNFTVRENRKEARLYITARGIYDCRLNGKPVTDTLLNPGCTQFDRHLLYQTYDVTDLLSGGENGIGVTLSSGWWCDAQTFVLRNYNYYGDKESFLAKLVVTYEDGSRDVVATDPEEWEYYGEGPYIYGGLFQGEQLCGQRLWEFEQFSLPDFHRIFSARSEDARKDAQEDGLFKKPAAVAPVPIESTVTMPAGFGRPWPAVNQGETCLSGSVQAPVKEVCRLHAVSMTEPRKGLYIYDLGQEMAGIPRLRLKGRAGDLVTVRYGEMLYPELPEYGSLHGLMLTENYRDAESIDLYTLRGDEEGEIYQPRFTFHGFRYIEICGVAEPPALEEVEGIQISSVSAITGGVKTSDALVNRLAENVKWSQLCNFISIPTDCPQRNERMGWAGDTHVFCRTASYQSDTRLFYYRYLEALRDLQEEDGSLPEIAPVGGGFGGITYEGAMIFILWELYQHYGDTQIVREYYPAARKWMDCIREKGMPGMAFVGPIDDWLAPAHTDSHLVWNAFYVRYTILMKRLARAIGEETSAVYFEKLEKEARAWFNETFVDPETGRTRGADGKLNETQCSYALPLAYEVFEEKYRENAYRYLAEATEKVDCTISTGFFGTGLICPMLTEGGNRDLAYRMLLQRKYPSWLYPVTQGATTIWERWNSYTVENGFGGNNSMNSFNHYSLGSVLSWIYETILGIQRDEEKPGFTHFTLKPDIRILDFAEGCINTPYGIIRSSWERKDDVFCYRCTIPANTTASLILPGRDEELLGSGTYAFSFTFTPFA